MLKFKYKINKENKTDKKYTDIMSVYFDYILINKWSK